MKQKQIKTIAAKIMALERQLVEIEDKATKQQIEEQIEELILGLSLADAIAVDEYINEKIWLLKNFFV